MRLRCGGTVVVIERVGVATCFLLSAVLLTLGMYVVFTHFQTTPPNESIESIKPTPIDQLLQRIMNDRRFDDVDDRSIQDSPSKKTQSKRSGERAEAVTSYGGLYFFLFIKFRQRSSAIAQVLS
jgi:hypothetical protein